MFILIQNHSILEISIMAENNHTQIFSDESMIFDWV